LHEEIALLTVTGTIGSSVKVFSLQRISQQKLILP
jgi:hypothetical protein